MNKTDAIIMTAVPPLTILFSQGISTGLGLALVIMRLRLKHYARKFHLVHIFIIIFLIEIILLLWYYYKNITVIVMLKW